MKQSRRASLIETVSSTAVGAIVAFYANLVVLPLFGYPVTQNHAFGMALVFTGISIVRSYLWRRFFEYLRITGVVR
jgi:hypothetical protein